MIQLSSGFVIIISQNSSKSIDPEPSSSSSSIIPSSSSSVRGARSSEMSPLKVSVVMNPCPSSSLSPMVDPPPRRLHKADKILQTQFLQNHLHQLHEVDLQDHLQTGTLVSWCQTDQNKPLDT